MTKQKRGEYEITKALEELRAKKARAKNLTVKENREYSQQARALMAELSALLTEGAKDCPNCGNKPHGIHQPRYYVVVCSATCGYRSEGRTVGEAVTKWNDEEYTPKRGTVLPTVKLSAKQD